QRLVRRISRSTGPFVSGNHSWIPTRARRTAHARDHGRPIHRLGGPARGRHRPGTRPGRHHLDGLPALPSRSAAAADFIETVTLTGARMYILAVIEHASRRIRVLGVTAHPTAARVGQAARNLVMDLEDAGSQVKYLIRDRDDKYPALFDSTRSWPTRESRSCSAASRCPG